MFSNAVPSLVQHVRSLAAAASSDEQLLEDYLARGSDEAFSALLGRHGPMVFEVCRRILHDTHAAEDVFQATFLVLADGAGAIRRRASLAGFLHGVAYRLAVRARRRRRMQSLTTVVCDEAIGPAEDLAWKEVLGILDHELSHLSDRYRAPLVLCYLEGRTQDEAARHLGWSLNTLRRRLAQGRDLLEARLRGRGITLPGALAGALIGGASVPGPLRAATLTAAGAHLVKGLTAGVTVHSSASEGVSLLLSSSGKKIGILVAVATLGAAACFGFRATQADHAPAHAPGPVTQASDPLPTRGVVRLGTTRYRHGNRIENMTVSADGRLAAVVSGWRSSKAARVFDLTDGQSIFSLAQDAERKTEAVGLSPDGKTLVIKDDRCLSIRDARTGKDIKKISYMQPSGGTRAVTDWLTFTPDGKRIAVTLMGDAVQLLDVGTGKVTRTFATGAAVSVCVFSLDGKQMATGGYDQERGVYLARSWEVASGIELRRFPAGPGRIRALAYSPDGTMLAGGGWKSSRLRIWEVATGKEPKVFPTVGEQSFESVAFAPDGRTVAVAGDRIYLYDPVTGKERLRIERRARALAFGSGGSVLTGAVSGAIYRWEAANGRLLTPSAALDSGVAQLLVRPDGRQVFTTDQDGNLHVWDTASRSSPRHLAGQVERGVVASPDGRFLAWAVQGDHGGSRIRLYDVAGRRVLDRFPPLTEHAAVTAFLPDGKTLLTLGGSRGATVRVWDVESGKMRRSFPISVRGPRVSWTSRGAALSPDGKTVATGLDGEEKSRIEERSPRARLWDVEGKAGHELVEPLNAPRIPGEAEPRLKVLRGLGRDRWIEATSARAFSPDGRLLVSWDQDPSGPNQKDHLCVWDATTGRAVATLAAGPRAGAANAAFAPDGRTLATTSADGIVRLWETATWSVRAEFHGHRDRVTALAFGPDGRLFTGGLDTVVLGWDVRPPRGAARGTLAAAWEALAAPDGKAGFAAQGQLLAEPGPAVAWFAARLTRAVGPNPARVKSLIANLDADDLATRDRATLELKSHWPATEAVLREVAAKASAPEARRRAERLVREMERVITPPEALRALRAAEILEWMGTKEARIVLLDLAKGFPDARLTREAAAACQRLQGRR